MTFDGFARAQAQYDAQVPPEPGEHDFTADVAVTFYLHLDGLTFDYGVQDEQMQDWMRDELMPRLKRAIRNEIEGQGTADLVVDSEYEITEIHE